MPTSVRAGYRSPLYLTHLWPEWELNERRARGDSPAPPRQRVRRQPAGEPPNALVAHARAFTPRQRRAWRALLTEAGIAPLTFQADANSGADLAGIPFGRLRSYRAWLLAWGYPDLLASLPEWPTLVALPLASTA